MTTNPRPAWRRATPVLTLALLTAACGGAAAPPAPDAPPDGVGAVVDWTDPSRAVEVGSGWVVRACQGDAPLLCVERDGQVAGLVEATTFPTASFDDFDPTASEVESITAIAERFLSDLTADRAIGCGEDYRFEPQSPQPFVLAGLPGVSYGFSGTMPDGTPSELILRYATIVGDHLVSVGADAYDDHGCLPDDEIPSFDSAGLRELRPHLEELLHQSPLPLGKLQLDGASS